MSESMDSHNCSLQLKWHSAWKNWRLQKVFWKTKHWSYRTLPTNTPRVFHVKTMWKQLLPRRLTWDTRGVFVGLISKIALLKSWVAVLKNYSTPGISTFHTRYKTTSTTHCLTIRERGDSVLSAGSSIFLLQTGLTLKKHENLFNWKYRESVNLKYGLCLHGPYSYWKHD